MKFEYLGSEISSYANIQMEMRKHATKATRMAECLNNTIWQNKHI